MTTWRGKRVPHDTLWRLAQHHASRIEAKQESGQNDGVFYDSMSAVIALAFAVEALLNFVGDRKLGKAWDERASYLKKIRALEQRLNFEYDKASEPYKTLESLKKGRDRMAHGKPSTFVLGMASEAEISSALQPEWSSVASPDGVLAMVRQVEAFKDFLLKRARIKPGAQFSSAYAEGE